MLSYSDFRETFQNSRAKGEYHHLRECVIQPKDTQEIGYVCVYVVKTTDVVIKEKV